MIDLTGDNADDPGFVDLITRIIVGSVTTYQPHEVRVFRIDNWFDHKWLRFSGKTLGQLGVWATPLTLPPFVSNRLTRQWRLVSDSATEGYQPTDLGAGIHHRGWAAENLQRRVKQLAPTCALFWFSGSTAETGRGSLMAYIPVAQEDDHWAWYLAFEREGGWEVVRRKNIHEYELRKFEEAAKNGGR